MTYSHVATIAFAVLSELPVVRLVSFALPKKLNTSLSLRSILRALL